MVSYFSLHSAVTLNCFFTEITE